MTEHVLEKCVNLKVTEQNLMKQKEIICGSWFFTLLQINDRIQIQTYACFQSENENV